MKKILLTLSLLGGLFFPLQAQVKIGNNPTTINANSVLEMESTNKGVLLPRVALTDTTLAAPLSAHVAGMFVYNTAGVNNVSPGIYYNDGSKWVRSSSEDYLELLYGSGAPTGSCSANSLYTDTLESSPTLGQQWTCSNGNWVSYTPAPSTEWYLKGTTNDAGGNKVSYIYRKGHIETRSADNLRSAKIMVDGGIRLFRDPASPAGITNGYIDFTNDESDPFPMRIAMRSDAVLNDLCLSFQDHSTSRMVIEQGGNVGIGTVVPNSDLHVAGTIRAMASGSFTGSMTNGTATVDGIELIGTAAAPYASIQRSSQGANLYLSKDISGSSQLNYLIFNRSSNTIGNIYTTNGANIIYGTTSDIRLKEDIRETPYGLSDLMRIHVSDYCYKADANKNRQTGFLAQELHAVFPEAVTPGGDDPQTEPWMVDYSRLTPLLVKAVQDQQKEIEQLRQENAALKARADQVSSLQAQVAELHTLKAEVANIKALLQPIAATH